MPGMTFGTRAKVAVLVVAAVGGYAGAAAINAFAAPSFAIADDFGPGDGLTRYVVSAATTDAAGLAAGVPEAAGVVSAQRLTDGRTLVATRGLTPADLQRVPGVTAVEVSPSAAVLGAVSDPYGATYGWNLENTGTNSYQQPDPPIADADTDAPDAWSAGTGTGMVVAVVDTGYDSDHEDLAGALWTNPDEPCGSVDTDGNGKAGDCHGWNFYANSADVDNGSYGEHGTSVSGVAAAREGNGLGSAGVAPGVTIMPLAVGGGSTVDVNLCSEAIRYAVDHGADVINASWGGAFTGSALAGLRSAIAYAAAHDVLVVAAAGNDGQNRDAAGSDLVYPAALTEDDVITVGNSTAADTASASSAWGPASVDLFAPGYLVLTTWNDGGYRFVSGTSIAAPQVAGVLALYRAAMPTASAAQLKQALLADVDPVAAFAGKSVSGGRLSAAHIGSTGGPRFTFTSTTSPAGAVTPHLAVSAPAAAGTYTVEIGVGMEDSGEIWALSGEDVALSGATLSTDDTGTALFTLGTRTSVDGEQIAPSLDLADGRYVLTVQLYRDGVPFGRASAAPLLVGTAATSPSTGTGTTPGTGTGTTPGTGTAPGTGTTPGSGTTPGTGTGTGTGTTPGTGTGTGSTPGAGTGTTPGTGTGTGTTPGTGSGTGSTPGTGTGTGTTPPAVGSTDPGAGSGGSTMPGTGTGTGTTPGTGSTPSTGAGTGSTPSTGTGAGGGTTPPSSGTGGSTTYPGTGPFGLVRIAPSTVTTGASTNVTITATALPAGPRVRIGGTTAAAVVSSSSTTLVFTAPGTLVAGSYDVAVFDAAGTTSDTLAGGLTYVDASTGGTTPGTGTGGSGTGGSGTGSPGTGGAGTGGTTPPSSGTGGTAPSTGTGSGSGSSATATTTGPHGERLVRSARFRALSTLWSLDCSSSCSGVAI